MHRRIVRAPQTACFADAAPYRFYADVLERLCDPRVPLTVRTDYDEDGQWTGRLAAVIRRRDLGLSNPRTVAANWLLFHEPFGSLACRAVVESHLPLFERVVADLDPEDWIIGQESPWGCEAIVLSDGDSLNLTLFASPECVRAALDGHLKRATDDGPAQLPVHEQLLSFARCLRALARGRYAISLHLDDHGIVHVDVDKTGLGGEWGFLAPAVPDSLDLAADAVLASHPRELDAFIASLDPAVWSRVACEYRFRHWGLKHEANTARFSCDASRVWHLMSARLGEAAAVHRTGPWAGWR